MNSVIQSLYANMNKNEQELFKVAEKRYKTYKYVYCYCSKENQIQVGVDAYKYINTFATFSGVTIMILVLSSSVSVLSKLISIVFLGIPAALVPPYNYFDTKKIMLEAGHSEDCSRKIARMYMLRASLWSEFKIMTEKDDGKRVWR